MGVILGFKPLTTNIPHHIETSQLICNVNRLTGFYMMRNTGCLCVNFKITEAFIIKLKTIEKTKLYIYYQSKITNKFKKTYKREDTFNESGDR